MSDKLRKMPIRELMSWLGNSQPGSAMRPAYEAEYERRKYVLSVWAIVVAAAGVMVAVAYNLRVFEIIRGYLLK